MFDVFALQGPELWLAIAVAVALFAGLLVPYLYEEIRRGKADYGPGFPTGTGDIHPGYVGNPLPDQPPLKADPYGAQGALSLRSFHLLLISLSIVLATGFGMWGLFHQYIVLGALSLGFALLLVVYGGYFVFKAENIHLE